MAIDTEVVFFYEGDSAREDEVGGAVGTLIGPDTTAEGHVAGLIDTAFDTAAGGRLSFEEAGEAITAAAFSVAFWINFDDVVNGAQVFWIRDTTTGMTIYCQTAVTASPTIRLRFTLEKDGSTLASQLSFPGTSVGANAWHHVMIRSENASAAFYAVIDGVQATGATTISTQTAFTDNQDIVIGGRNGATLSDGANAQIEQFVVYNEAKAIADAVSLYNSGSGVPHADIYVGAEPAVISESGVITSVMSGVVRRPGTMVASGVLSDVPAAAVRAAGAVSESGVLTLSPAASLQAVGSISESAAASSFESAGITYPGSISESGVFSDSFSGISGDLPVVPAWILTESHGGEGWTL